MEERIFMLSEIGTGLRMLAAERIFLQVSISVRGMPSDTEDMYCLIAPGILKHSVCICRTGSSPFFRMPCACSRSVCPGVVELVFGSFLFVAPGITGAVCN